MRDFTLEAYRKYLLVLLDRHSHLLRFDQYLSDQKNYSTFCLIRHDVDRKANNALEMAQLEAELGVQSTYYFRTKPSVFKIDIIREIAALGHEIGFHYECLSDAKGDRKKALELFKVELTKFKGIAEIKSISMHGRPLSPYDNRDLWKFEGSKKYLLDQFGILGEVYLHIDYKDIAYIGDTGRTWNSGRSNKRDKVDSQIQINPNNGSDLLKLFQENMPQKMVFQIHPERWTDNFIEYIFQLMKDIAFNQLKKFR
ncbi:MAG: hypothetical protein RH916_12290 [Vicingaceae bacterium]